MANNLKITLICGHYGCGKTNLCLNLALKSVEEGNKTVVVDMDIVNPYFRSSEYHVFLRKNNIQLIAPNFANSNLDTPSLPSALYSIFAMENTNVFIDVGGDDAGATAVGRIHEELKEVGYSMIYVVNCNRVNSRNSEEAVGLLKEIEAASRLKATEIVNNSHLGVDSDFDSAVKSLAFAKEVSEKTGLALSYSTIPDFALKENKLPEGFILVKRLVLFPWEMTENI